MKINFFAPMNQLGYGIHAYNLLRAFESRGNHVTLVPPFGQVSFSDEHIERWMKGQTTFEKNSPGVMIFHEEYLSQFVGSPRIGFPVFEMEKFTDRQMAMMETCDYLFTPSKWGEMVLKNNGFKNVFVVNEGFDPNVFPIVFESESQKKDEPFTFIHVGKFEARKGTIQVIRAFFHALEDENARLLMHVDNPFVTDYSEIHSALVDLGFLSTNQGGTYRRMSLSVHFSNSTPTHSQIANLYQKADCGIFPTRAEGWGLPILEMMASGVPCIVGNWTGQSEYLDAIDDGFQIRKFERQPARDSIWFDGSRGNWNVPDHNHIVELIKLAFVSSRGYRKSEAWRNSIQYLRGFTWNRAAEQLETAIKQTCGW